MKTKSIWMLCRLLGTGLFIVAPGTTSLFLFQSAFAAEPAPRSVPFSDFVGDWRFDGHFADQTVKIGIDTAGKPIFRRRIDIDSKEQYGTEPGKKASVVEANFEYGRYEHEMKAEYNPVEKLLTFRRPTHAEELSYLGPTFLSDYRTLERKTRLELLEEQVALRIVSSDGCKTIMQLQYSGPDLRTSNDAKGGYVAGSLEITQRRNSPPMKLTKVGGCSQAPEITRESDRIRISLQSSILFDFDAYSLKPEAEAVLARIKSSILDQHRGAKLIVNGYTDDRGSLEYNLRLSQRRSEAVESWLAKTGIEPVRMIARGYGKNQPKYPNDTEENRSRNRRVEIEILTGDAGGPVNQSQK